MRSHVVGALLWQASNAQILNGVLGASSVAADVVGVTTLVGVPILEDTGAAVSGVIGLGLLPTTIANPALPDVPEAVPNVLDNLPLDSEVTSLVGDPPLVPATTGLVDDVVSAVPGIVDNVVPLVTGIVNSPALNPLFDDILEGEADPTSSVNNPDVFNVGSSSALDLSSLIESLTSASKISLAPVSTSLSESPSSSSESTISTPVSESPSSTPVSESSGSSSSTPVSESSESPSSTPVSESSESPSSTPSSESSEPPSSTPVSETSESPSTTPVSETSSESPSSTPTSETSSESESSSSASEESTSSPFPITTTDSSTSSKETTQTPLPTDTDTTSSESSSEESSSTSYTTETSSEERTPTSSPVSESSTLSSTVPTSSARPTWQAAPWSGDDNGNYDGEDYDDEPCPKWCRKQDDYNQNKDEDNHDADDSESYSLLKRFVGMFRRRGEPSSDGGFASFKWPGGQKKEEEECDEDIPDWLYENTGKKPNPCKRKCPKSCFKPYPTKGGNPDKKPYPTTEPYSPEEPYTTKDSNEPYTTETPYEPYTSEEPYESYTSELTYDWTATETDESTPTVAPELDSTTTLTTFTTIIVTAPSSETENPTGDEDDWGPESTSGGYPEPAPTDDVHPEPESPDGDAPVSSTPSTGESPVSTTPSTGDSGYVGDTLDTVCPKGPKQCYPFDPSKNKCDVTTSCADTGNSKYYCTCRSGYRASAWNPKDFSKQFRLTGQAYVYVAEGVVCNTVCSDPTCSEVLPRPVCQ